MAEENGNTEETLAQKEAELKTLAEELEAVNKRVEDAQAMITKQSAEIGDDRTSIKESANTIRDLGKKVLEEIASADSVRAELAKAKEELIDLKKKGPIEEKNTQTSDDEKPVEEIEAALTTAEQAVVDQCWKDADEETRKSIKSDPILRKQVLIKAKEAAKVAKDSDLTDWRSTPAQKETGKAAPNEELLAKMFNKLKDSASNIPDGPNNGAPRRPINGRKGEIVHKKASWIPKQG